MKQDTRRHAFRDAKLLQFTNGPPGNNEGSDGSMWAARIEGGLAMYVKDAGSWFRVGGDAISAQTSEVSSDNASSGVMVLGYGGGATGDSGGHISILSQLSDVSGTTGTGSTVVMDTSPTITTADLNTPDIDGGTVDGITSLTVADHVDIGNYKLTAKAFTASDLTSGRVTFAGTAGLLADDADLTFSGQTLTATKIGAFQATGAIDFNDQNMTKVDIDSGDISAATISGGLTWSSAQDMNSQALTNVNIDSGDISAATISGGLTWSSAQDMNSQALTNVNIDGGDISASTISGGLTWSSAQDFATGTTTIATVDCNAGAIDGTTIGLSSHTTIKGTTIDATTDFTVGTTVITSGVITDATLSLAGDVDCTGAHSATTYDADTDFTVGNTVITTNKIDHSGTLNIDAVTEVEISTPTLDVDVTDATINSATSTILTAPTTQIVATTGAATLDVNATTLTMDGTTGTINYADKLTLDSTTETEMNTALLDINAGTEVELTTATFDVDATTLTMHGTTGTINYADKLTLDSTTETEMNTALLDINAGTEVELTTATFDVDATTLTMSGTTATITYPTTNITASTIVDMTTPELQISGDIDIAGDIDMATGKLITWVDDNTKISGTATTLDLNSDGTINITGPTVDINGTLTSKFVVTGEDQDLQIKALGGGADQTLNFVSQGTSVNAMVFNASAGGMNIDAALGLTIDAGDNMIFTSTTGSIDLETSGEDGDIKIKSAHTTAGSALWIDCNADASSLVNLDAGILDIDASGSITIDSAGTIGIGIDDVDQAINIGTQGERTISIGTGAFPDTINIGNAEGATAVNVTTGSGGLTMTTGTNGNVSIDPHGTGNLTLGSADNTTTALAGNIMTVTSAGTMTIDSGGVLIIDTDGTDNISLGVEAVAKTITVGNAASTMVDINALALDFDGGSITMDGTSVSIDGTLDSNLTVTGSAKDLDIAVAGGGAQELRIVSAGEGDGSPAMKLDVTAGSMKIAPSLIDGRRLALGNSSSTYMAFTPGSAATEKIYIGNVGGTSDLAMKFEAISGGMTLYAGTVFNVDAVGAITIDSSAGTIGIGVDDIDQDINIGTDGERAIYMGYGAKEVTVGIGNSEAETSVTILSGTGDINMGSEDNVGISAKYDISLTTTTADGEIKLVSAHTAGRALHIDCNAHTASEVDIDAGIMTVSTSNTGQSSYALGSAGGINLSPTTHTYHASGKKISWNSDGTDEYIYAGVDSDMELKTSKRLTLRHDNAVGEAANIRQIKLDSKVQVGDSFYFSNATAISDLDPNTYSVTPTVYYPSDNAEGFRYKVNGVNAVAEGEMPTTNNINTINVSGLSWKNTTIDCGTTNVWDIQKSTPEDAESYDGDMTANYSLLGFTNFYRGSDTRKELINGNWYTRNSVGIWEDRDVHT